MKSRYESVVLSPAPSRDNRREPRRAADGEVKVWFGKPRSLVIEGRLVDVSASGFRMAHEYAALEAGQMVDFSHLEASGRARVVWTRIAGTRVETGFLVDAG
jgi:hypothetical protein